MSRPISLGFVVTGTTPHPITGMRQRLSDTFELRHVAIDCARLLVCSDWKNVTCEEIRAVEHRGEISGEHRVFLDISYFAKDPQLPNVTLDGWLGQP